MRWNAQEIGMCCFTKPPCRYRMSCTIRIWRLRAFRLVLQDPPKGFTTTYFFWTNMLLAHVGREMVQV